MVAGLLAGGWASVGLAQPIPWVALKPVGETATFYWNDAENWLEGQVPDSERLGIAAVIVVEAPPNPLIWGDRGPEDVLTSEEVTDWLARAPGQTVVVYRNPENLPTAFSAVELDAFPAYTSGDTALEFRIEDDLDAISLVVGNRVTVKHFQSTITSSIEVGGGEATARYELGGTAVVNHERWFADQGAFSIGSNGTLAISGGRIDAAMSELKVKGSALGAALYQQSGGEASFVLATVGYGGNAAIEVSGGTLDLSPISGGREVRVGYLTASAPETVPTGAEARLSVSGGKVRIKPGDGETTELVIGEDYQARLQVSGTGALEVYGDIFLGGKSNGYLEIEGGSLDALRLWVGNSPDNYAADTDFHGESIAVQNGGTVTLHYDPGVEQYGLRIGAPNGKEHSYTLNAGTLNTDVTLVGDHAAFVQNGGAHTTEFLKLQSDVSPANYTLNAGTLVVTDHASNHSNAVFTINGGTAEFAELAVSSNGTFNYLGGTVSATSLDLIGSAAHLNHGAGLTLSVSGGADLSHGFVYTVPTGGELEIGGQTNLLGESRIDVAAGVLSIAAASVFDDARLVQAGGNVVATGDTWITDRGGWEQSAGTTLHTATLELGTVGGVLGAASYVQTGGVFSGKTLEVNSGGKLQLDGGTTTFGQDARVAGLALLGNAADLTVRDLSLRLGGALTQSGGELTARTLTVTGDAVAYLDGGTATIGSGGLQVTDISDAGTVRVDGATVTAASAQIGNGGVVRVYSGGLDVAGTTTVASQGALHGQGGTFETGALTIAAGGVARFSGGASMVDGVLDTAAQLFVEGGSLTAGSAVLRVGSVTTVSGNTFTVSGSTQLDGALVIDGGTFSTQTLLGDVATHLDWRSGTFQVTGATFDLALNPAWGNALTISGGRSIKVGGNLLLRGTDAFTVESGAAEFGSATIETGGSIMVSGGEVDFGAGSVIGGDIMIDGGSVETNGSTTIVAGGTVTVVGGELNLGGDTTVESGGEWEISSGEVHVAGETRVEGSLTLSGGTFETDSFVYAPGTFTWTGGTFDFGAGNLEVSSSSNWGPVLGITAGQTLRLGGLIDVLPGGSFTLAGGTVAAGNLNVVQNSTQDFLINAGGVLSVTGNLNYDGVRVITPGAKYLQVSGGAMVSVGGDFNVGTWSRVSQAGGSSIQVTGTLRLGTEDWHETEYLLSGSNTTLTTGSTVVGAGGQGTFTQFGDAGLQHVVGGDLVVGQGATGRGTYTLRARAQVSAGRLLVGQDGGTGTVTSTEATILVADIVENRGTLTQSGGAGRRGSTSAAGFINYGTTTLSETTLNAPVANHGTMNLQGYVAWQDGATHVNDGTLVIDRGSSDFFYVGAGSTLTNLTGGRIEGIGGIGNGTGVRSSILDHGVLAPGLGAGEVGQLTVFGNYSQFSDGVIALEIAGLSASSYDRLSVSINGAATFAGGLAVSFVDGYAGTAGDVFNLITGANTTYSFATVDVAGLVAGLAWRTFSDGGTFGIEVFAPAPDSPVPPVSAVPEPAGIAVWAGLMAWVLAVVGRRPGRI